MKILSVFLFALLVLGSTAFYDRFSAVKSLTASDFSQVKKGVWLVEFYATWCGHCRNLAPEYEKAANALKGIANIAAIEADKEKTDVQVQGFPTIKFFQDGKMSDYDGARTASGIVDFMFRKLRNVRLILARLPTRDWEEVEDRVVVKVQEEEGQVVILMRKTLLCLLTVVSKRMSTEMSLLGSYNSMLPGVATARVWLQNMQS